MFKGQPKGLYALALANTGERFGYYTMLAVFALFLRENFGLTAGFAGGIYSVFLGLVYFMPLVGGIMADKFGFGKMVTIGISIMFAGYLLLSFPLGGDTIAMIAMMAALLFISLGTGLFKGNLQVMVGDLYNDPKYADKRDSGFSLFYMAINVGSLFAPTTAVGIKAWAQNSLGYSSNDAYHFAFAVACVALILSIVIYYAFRSTFRHVEGGKVKGEATIIEDNLTPAETKSRIVALCLVFAVVIFFWMAFHQNGLTLTYFADEFTNTSASGFQTMFFNVWNLVLVVVAVYTTFSIFQSETAKAKLLSGLVATASLAYLVYKTLNVGNATINVSAPIFQQFNPFYVVALTPFSMAIFGALAKKGKEPSAPRKIAYGMLVASIGFAVMAFASDGLNTPNDQIKSITVEKAETIAVGIYNAQDDATVANFKKAKEDYENKVTEENKALFAQVYDATTASLEAGTYTPNTIVTQLGIETKPVKRVSPYWLIFTYLILTFAELLLSPMGISFVSKVAPPKYKGLMMGGWFVATALGNILVSVGGFLWAGLPLWSVWTVFITLCLLSALFMFVMMKRLESATK